MAVSELPANPNAVWTVKRTAAGVYVVQLSLYLYGIIVHTYNTVKGASSLYVYVQYVCSVYMYVCVCTFVCTYVLFVAMCIVYLLCVYMYNVLFAQRANVYTVYICMLNILCCMMCIYCTSG